MANNIQQDPFWDFVRSFGGPNGPNRASGGVDHTNFEHQFPPGFPFGSGQGWGRWGGHHGGRGGGHGRHGGHSFQQYRDAPEFDREEDQEEDHEMESSPDTMRPTPDESVNGDVPPPPPPGAFPHHPPPPPEGFSHSPPPPPAGGPNPPPPPPPFHGRHQPFGGPQRGRGGRRGYSGRGRRGQHPHPHPHPPPPSGNGAWNFGPLMHMLAGHPYAQAFKDFMDQARADPSDESNEQQDDSFTPPVDVFNTEKAYVLHVSLPGAQKEDIGLNWDGEKINIAGVVHRPGNEEFLQSLAPSERKVGMFERSIKLPPAGSDDKEDIDGVGITAKMENGILIVTVPKTEKEWTQIHKVEIQ
ncbi:hypothetical protein M426DRAFT_19894 [Hypoxylon sp. CI-4A]|nr:hypothetical protein M426DRAFT_19894 [Hypoxylon sp. CI-4A]